MILGQKDMVNTLLSMKLFNEYCFYSIKDLAGKRFPDLGEEDCENLQIETETLLKRLKQLIGINYNEKSIASAVKKDLPNINLDIIEKAVNNYFTSLM